MSSTTNAPSHDPANGRAYLTGGSTETLQDCADRIPLNRFPALALPKQYENQVQALSRLYICVPMALLLPPSSVPLQLSRSIHPLLFVAARKEKLLSFPLSSIHSFSHSLFWCHSCPVHSLPNFRNNETFQLCHSLSLLSASSASLGL